MSGAVTRLAIFDCDGTLVDSAVAICEAMEGCFAGQGLAPPDRAATRQVVGLSLYEAMQSLHPAGGEAQHRVMAEDYKLAFQRLRGLGRVEEPLFPGVADMLRDLEEAGWRLGVATGKSDRGLKICLEAHGIARRFATLQTADRHPSKPHPAMLLTAMAEAGADPARSVMIGDTRFDMGAAKAAGITAIGVAWGYHGVAELRAEGADHVVTDAAELVPLLESL